MNDSDSGDIAVDDEVEGEDKAEDDKKNKGEKRKTKSQKKLLSESGHYCHRVCQQCILGLAVSLADQG